MAMIVFFTLELFSASKMEGCSEISTCPDACYATTFDSELSMSSLSELSVSNLLESNTTGKKSIK